MPNFASAVPVLRRWSPALAVLLVAAVAASAGVGGEYRISYGKGRIAVKGAGVAPAQFIANLRVDFDGVPADEAGTGDLLAYDEIGQNVIGQFPVEWTSRGKSGFVADLDVAGFETFVAARIEEITGGTVTCTVDVASAKGAVLRDGTRARVAVKASGDISLDGGPIRRFKATLRGK